MHFNVGSDHNVEGVFVEFFHYVTSGIDWKFRVENTTPNSELLQKEFQTKKEMNRLVLTT